MGSYISVGFVFQNDKLSLKTQMIKHIIESLNLNDYSMLIFKGSEDIDGNHWVEKKLMFRNITDEDYQLMTDYFYGNVLMMCTFLEIKNQMINITFYKEKDYFGYLMDLFEDPFRKQVTYATLESSLIEYLKAMHEQVPFDYAILENDGEIEFSPDEMNFEEMNYSVLIQADEKEGLVVKKGEYLIDGRTKRTL